LQADGWYLRQDIIWHKPNPMPESVTDRCTKSHEYIFLMAKSEKYFYDAEAIKEDCESEPQTRDRSKEGYGVALGDGRDRFSQGARTYGLGGKRNKRSVWTITTKPFKEAHFATFPEDLIVPMVKAGCPKDGICLDPFMGAGTTAVVARKLGRKYLGIEINPEYIKIAEKRLSQQVLF
jgi:DNA modification methylase